MCDVGTGCRKGSHTSPCVTGEAECQHARRGKSGRRPGWFHRSRAADRVVRGLTLMVADNRYDADSVKLVLGYLWA
jgi:hypothetical protein